MSYEAIFNGWSSLTLSDLLVAYRKAKADCHFESIFPTAVKFAEYEQDLLANLNNLLAQLHGMQGFSKDEELLGECRLIPKKLGVEPKDGARDGHVHFSDPGRAFESLCEKNDLKPEFRVIGDFPVNAHILSSLWVNMVGHKFDACLDDTAYGSRLRRVRNDEVLDKEAPKSFHISAVGSFQPYFQPYQRWRNDGLKSIRDELENDRNVIAVSLDLRSYYHLVDPSCIASKVFEDEIGLTEKCPLTSEERQFTKELADFLSRWSSKASKFAGNLLAGEKKSEVYGGLVIGLTASRIISNVLLQKWDKLIREKVTPIHYGRYVDDMFLVMHDPGTLNDSQSFMHFLQERLGTKTFKQCEDHGDTWEICLGKPYQKKTKIELQAAKQKLFILEGQAGCDLLDSIEKEINELSSEHRLMPAPDQLEHSTAARVLSAAGAVGEQADTLRRADGLTIRRLGWSLQLRYVETLAHDLPASVWKKEREEFYTFAHNHILRPDSLFAHFQYLPRLLGFAIGLNEWVHAEAIVNRSFHSLELLEKSTDTGNEIAINGATCNAGKDLWRYVKGSLSWSFIDAAAKHYPPDMLFDKQPKKRVLKLAEVFMQQLWQELTSLEDILDFPLDAEEFYNKAPLLASSDLAKVPYKRVLSSEQAQALLNINNKQKERSVLKAFQSIDLLDIDDLKDFLNTTRNDRLNKVKKGKRSGESYRPYLFPTRPYTPSEIAELAPECVGLGKPSKTLPHELWGKYVRALRGVWVKPALLTPSEDEAQNSSKKKKGKKNITRIGTNCSKTVTVAITNIATSDESWAASASGKPALTLERYISISNLVNQAIQLQPKPDYLIFPELSLPLEWVNSVSGRLLSAGISLVAGTEYRHLSKNEVVSEACLELADDRLGYPSSVRIYQPKLEPAVGEDKELTSKFGKTWKDYKGVEKPIYNHNDFHFGVMVCAELQNSKERVSFQGYVDALMVLSWNQDLDTFSALVEASALDVHAYTILVNNRKYGDSRVRSPAKESFRRDIARLRGGKNDFCVAVELDIEKLRAFQSRAKRWPEDNDPFKPVPGGFTITSGRKVLPPK